MNDLATGTFILSAVFIIYVLAGYPVLLALLSRRGASIRKKPSHHISVSVLLPVHNGELWVQQKLESIQALKYPRELMEIIVVSDGSTDRTDEIVKRFESARIRFYRIPRSGKASALNTAVQHATGDILFFTDVRQQLEPSSLAHLVSCFSDPQVGVASGELIIRKGETLGELNVGLYWRYEKWIRKHLSRVDSVIGASGCIYAMRRELATPLSPDTLLDDVQLPLGAFFRGYRIILDESAKAFDYPTSLKAEFHRKVRTQAGVYQTIRSFPALLGPSNRMWFHFISHKVGRLLLPFALLLLLASSFGLPPVWKWAALSAQAGFYLVALLNPLIPEGSPVKRITSPCWTFVVLIAAALCGISVLFVPSRKLWKQTEVRQSSSVA
ncbi:MAG: glycosyltransferase family 2 protein [Bryobacterales bacterium]|nr:glycosyltransferase family 2 protein [Bryobacterales bacterium]